MYINNYFDKVTTGKTTITGLAGKTRDAADTTSLDNVNTYDTENGGKASTNGNITGVYDINGGLTEYTASCYTGAELLNGGGATKYIMSYSSATEAKKGDAVLETTGWENCNNIAISSSVPYFMRGEPGTSGKTVTSLGGQFAYNSSNGAASMYRGFRTVLIVE